MKFIGLLSFYCFILSLNNTHVFAQTSTKVSCPNKQLPLSHISEEIQPSAGLCYAYRDTKAMKFLLDDLGIEADISILDSSVQVHRHFLRIKQLLAKKMGEDYNKGNTVLESGENCEVINNFLKHGFCKNDLITSKTFDQIYNFILGLEKDFLYVNKLACEEKNELIDDSFKIQMAELFRSTLMTSLSEEKQLSNKEKEKLKSIILKITDTKNPFDYPKMVKKLELMARRKCGALFRKKYKELNKYKCEDTFLPSVSSSENYRDDNKKILLKYLKRMNVTPLMVGLCSSDLFGQDSKRPADKSFNETVGDEYCGPHALIIAGSRSNAGTCQVLIEDNYGTNCKERPWIECEKDKEGNTTGRMWIDINDVSSTLIGISAIQKK